MFSKGVFLGYRRPDEHQSPLIFEMGKHGDTLTCIPWGPLSLWGPTETWVDSIEEGFVVEAEDIAFLKRHAEARLHPKVLEQGVVSLRCGLRPLAVPKDFHPKGYPLELSRHHRIVADPHRPWISVYGGKISGCLSMAEKAAGVVSRRFRPTGRILQHEAERAGIPHESFPGLREQVPAISWCVEKEFCCTLEDYLRRRTNIAQWIPREGLGECNENRVHLEKLAGSLLCASGHKPGELLDGYEQQVRERFDPLLERSHA